jgi:adenine-specific DNA-methyltransferase
VQQGGAVCEFENSDSWVILSPIEQSIKRKIEAVGTPLKDWDINIYRGVLTGYNEAFIISTEKREEILANCQSEDERERTAELIRPILRGRDIKRYGYNWANLWLINTHNGIRGKLERIHIEDYPAVKTHLDQYWDRISKRADKGDTPYNLRNCAYLEDFNKPKIVWGEISDRSKFAFEAYGSFIPEATTFLMVGSDLSYLLCVLNSPLSEWFFSKVGTTTGVGTVRWKKYTIQELLIPFVNVKLRQLFQQIVEKYVIGNITSEQLSKYSNKILYEVVGLIDEEIEFVENFYPPLI